MEKKLEKVLYAFYSSSFKFQTLYQDKKSIVSHPFTSLTLTNNSQVYKTKVTYASFNTLTSLWHSRLCHPSSKIIKNVLDNIIKVFHHSWLACCLGKVQKLPFLISDTIYSAPLKVCYTDL